MKKNVAIEAVTMIELITEEITIIVKIVIDMIMTPVEMNREEWLHGRIILTITTMILAAIMSPMVVMNMREMIPMVATTVVAVTTNKGIN